MRDVDVPRRAGGFLDFSKADGALRNAVSLWLADEIEIYENDSRLPRPRVVDARVSLESDRSFGSYESAVANFSAPRLKNPAELYWNQGLMDVLLEYPIGSEKSDFSIRPRLERLGIRVSTIIRFINIENEVRPFDLHGDPGLVRLDPRWHQAALSFVRSGFMHILEGADHLLFLLLLVAPFRRFLPLAAIVTAFTVAHSITLISAALGYGPRALWFPVLIETLIAVSILYMALENVLGASLQRRWMLALGFGLVHGFGFAYGLQQLLQFAGSHLLTSLLAFNLGVELGQLAVLLLFIPVLNFLFKYLNEKAATLILSLLVGHTAWHWMLERGEKLARFPFPALDEASIASAIRWLMALLVFAALAWAVSRSVRRRLSPRGPSSESPRAKAR